MLIVSLDNLVLFLIHIMYSFVSLGFICSQKLEKSVRRYVMELVDSRIGNKKVTQRGGI